MKSQAPMRQRSDQHSASPASAGSGRAYSSESSSIDPLFHLLRILPFSFLRPPRIRLKIPSTISLPSPMTVFSLVLLTYFAVVSGFVYDVIVEPPGIGSVQDPVTRAVKPVVFLPGRVNGQYIIEGLSSGFMFVLGGLGLIFMDLALDRSRAHSVRVSLASFGIAAVVISYVMAMLFIRIKIPGYLW
ncbi:Oligosaccharyltransferase complex subunit ostc [Rhynchospora pubera]|uniref:Oligosaccharyltransferase complex subunit ostc n=1 Tax=Rhynchospora pubera TaxID=906938 RepID=A0AAV8FHY6_9POAL|nr:Oligosaccharyltransferase complex subunit ostc [Rhynchospora pubera]KAJ4761980.1 Oligosaccharyltransferase complex subunit ostc [Rhynchospora pubera]KAJ4790636.1 Oligosaccharyltransferase complex subunit ostc [Rhynchospora pubera]KAJ4814473.1 Oligosaccharyltransferase complex subunit ostc [Rhynchospora pubera]